MYNPITKAQNITVNIPNDHALTVRLKLEFSSGKNSRATGAISKCIMTLWEVRSFLKLKKFINVKRLGRKKQNVEILTEM